jgi:hypothetical protein
LRYYAALRDSCEEKALHITKNCRKNYQAVKNQHQFSTEKADSAWFSQAIWSTGGNKFKHAIEFVNSAVQHK